MTYRFWTPEEDAVLIERYATTATKDLAEQLGRSPTAVYQRAKDLDLYKSADYKKDLYRRLTLDLVVSGASHKYATGNTPWNKGRKGKGLYKTMPTQFQPGNVNTNELPVGSEKVIKGYLYRKVALLRGGQYKYNNRWKPVHRLLWEEHNGPIPPDHFVIFLDGDTTHIELNNLACIPKAVHAWINRHGYSKLSDADLCRSAIAIAEIELKLNQLKPSRVK